MLFAQFQAKRPSSSLRAAETPPEPLSGTSVPWPASHSCTEETRIASVRETKL